MSLSEKLAGIGFVQVPPSLSLSANGFAIDPTIPIPIETAGRAEAFKPEAISFEAIIAGMIRVLVYDPDNAHSEYYRGFVRAAKPDILAEFSQAGVFKAKNKEREIAEEIFLALEALFPEQPEPLLDLAVLYEDMADAAIAAGNDEEAQLHDEKAFDLYKRLIGFEPAFPEGIFNAGYFFLKRHSYDRAKELFATYARIGTVKEKRERAREIAKKLEGQGYLDQLFKEAYDFIKLGQEEKGIEKATLFLESYPKVWNGWFLLGWANRRLGRWAAGKEAFRKALDLVEATGSLAPAETIDCYNELSICLLELGELEESRRLLEKALRKEPDNVKVIANLGILALKRERPDEAAGFFRAALEYEPEDPIAKRYLAMIDKGEV